MIMKVWVAHERGLAEMGEVPDSVTLEVFSGEAYPSDPADVEFWVPPFLAPGQMTGFLSDMTGLTVVQLMSAGAEVWVPKVADSVTLCDAQGVHTASTAEWALTAILASSRGFDRFARAQERRSWEPEVTDGIAGMRALILGAGDIGEAIAKRLVACDVSVTKVARRSRPGVHGVAELPRLLPDADIVVVIVPLTDATRGMVDAKFLAQMRDGALLVNAARGPVVDTDALTAEVGAGRLRAALDVTDPEPLPSEHPLWTMPGALITPHVGGAVHGFLPRAYRLVGEQLRRYAADQPLANVVTEGY